MQPLLQMAVVIRSKNAGINRLTYDIVFHSAPTTTALRSNLFHKAQVAKLLGLPAEQVVGTFYVDSCIAIKITLGPAQHLGFARRARRFRCAAAGCAGGLARAGVRARQPADAVAK
ncbi:MAG: DUF4387 family protein [Burkholderiaceae bacterium]